LKENFAGEDKKGMNGSKQINKPDYYFPGLTKKTFCEKQQK
jgi:hypothetical protein